MLAPRALVYIDRRNLPDEDSDSRVHDDTDKYLFSE